MLPISSNKQNVVYLHNGILSSNKKKETTVTCDIMDETL